MTDQGPCEVLTCCYELTANRRSPREARALVSRICREWALDDVVDDAVIVVNELVTNAVEHAESCCQLTLTLDHAGLIVAVRDNRSGGLPEPNPVGGLQRRGRGLTMWRQ